MTATLSIMAYASNVAENIAWEAKPFTILVKTVVGLLKLIV